jgi:MFS family permease
MPTSRAIQWVTSGYLLALALMLPLNGWLVERIGAKALYLWCFSAFTLSSALCGIAWSANALIAFRILQGLSGGLMAPMTQKMITRAAGILATIFFLPNDREETRQRDLCSSCMDQIIWASASAR